MYITDIEWCHEVNMCVSFKCIDSYATKCNGFYSDGQGVVQEVWVHIAAGYETASCVYKLYRAGTCI